MISSNTSMGQNSSPKKYIDIQNNNNNNNNKANNQLILQNSYPIANNSNLIINNKALNTQNIVLPSRQLLNPKLANNMPVQINHRYSHDEKNSFPDKTSLLMAQMNNNHTKPQFHPLDENNLFINP